jgi:hypothetical protein
MFLKSTLHFFKIQNVAQNLKECERATKWAVAKYFILNWEFNFNPHHWFFIFQILNGMPNRMQIYTFGSLVWLSLTDIYNTGVNPVHQRTCWLLAENQERPEVAHHMRTHSRPWKRTHSRPWKIEVAEYRQKNIEDGSCPLETHSRQWTIEVAHSRPWMITVAHYRPTEDHGG